MYAAVIVLAYQLECMVMRGVDGYFTTTDANHIRVAAPVHSCRYIYIDIYRGQLSFVGFAAPPDIMRVQTSWELLGSTLNGGDSGDGGKYVRSISGDISGGGRGGGGAVGRGARKVGGGSERRGRCGWEA